MLGCPGFNLIVGDILRNNNTLQELTWRATPAVVAGVAGAIAANFTPQNFRTVASLFNSSMAALKKIGICILPAQVKDMAALIKKGICILPAQEKDLVLLPKKLCQKAQDAFISTLLWVGAYCQRNAALISCSELNISPKGPYTLIDPALGAVTEPYMTLGGRGSLKI